MWNLEFAVYGQHDDNYLIALFLLLPSHSNEIIAKFWNFYYEALH